MLRDSGVFLSYLTLLDNLKGSYGLEFLIIAEISQEELYTLIIKSNRSKKMENANEDWRKDITESKETLKIADKEEVNITFLNEGKKRESKDFGNSIAFAVKKDGEDIERTFFVRSNNFTFLGEIKQLGKLTGKKFKISRTGKLKSDTRYKITPLS